MIGDLGVPELLIILVLVVLLFGAGKVSRIGKDLGTAIKEFRGAVRDDSNDAPINLLGTSTPANEMTQTTTVLPEPTAERRPPAVF